MGYSYVVAEGDPKDISEALGFHVKGEAEAPTEGGAWTAQLSDGGWTVVRVADDGFVGSRIAQLERLSKGKRVYTCAVDETKLESEAVHFRAGKSEWRVAGTGPQAAGQPSPEDMKRIFELPLRHVEKITGYAPDTQLAGGVVLLGEGPAPVERGFFRRLLTLFGLFGRR
ncbi:MAG: hypothetical protein ACU0CO_11075 [Shimia sp.]